MGIGEWELFNRRKPARWEPAEEVVAFFHEQMKRPVFLDLGCGYGRHLALAARFGFDVVGLDWDGRAVEGARMRLVTEGFVGVVEVADITQPLKCRDASVSMVLDASTIQHLDAAARKVLAAEVARILAPGGLVLSLTEAWQLGLAGYGREVEPGTFTDFQEGTPWAEYPRLHFFTEEEIEGLWEGAGLKVLSLRPYEVARGPKMTRRRFNLVAGRQREELREQTLGGIDEP